MPRARSSGDDLATDASIPRVADFALSGRTHSRRLPVSRARRSRQLRQTQRSWLPPTFGPWTVRFGLASRKPRPWSAPYSSPREVSPRANAERYKAVFFRTYAGVARWHQQIRWEQAAEVRTLAGRRVTVDPGGFYGAKANYVVQGTGGDGLKVALALLWERRHEVPGAFPVLAVHDEIVIEADADQADAVAAWLKRAMMDAMAPLIAPVPVEVEVKVGATWGGAD